MAITKKGLEEIKEMFERNPTIMERLAMGAMFVAVWFIGFSSRRSTRMTFVNLCILQNYIEAATKGKVNEFLEKKAMFDLMT